MKRLLWIGTSIGIVAVGLILFFFLFPQLAKAPDDGRVVPAYNENILVLSPAPNATITSPVTITGEARGTYYFEASFPIEILDKNRVIIGQGHAEAQSDWMTENFVPFLAYVTFTSPGAGQSGTLRLKKDNPSGLPEHDAHFDIPVKF